jgi:glycosyltransferase involved in cell wall biosynthesis
MANPAEPFPLRDFRVLVLFTGSRLFGHERANIEVFRTLKELGLNSRFIVDRRWSRAEIQPALDEAGLEFRTAPYGYQWGGFLRGRHWYVAIINFWGVLATSAKVLGEIARWKPTHVYAANALHLSYAIPALSLSRLPLIYRAGDELPEHNALHRWIKRWVIRRAATVVCISQYIQKRYFHAGFPSEKSTVIYNYPPRRSPVATSLVPEANQTRSVITFIGQISEHKGVVVLLEAVEQMLESRRDLTLWLVGAASWETGLLELLRARVKERGLESAVVFWGYREDISTFLTKTDVHVCPSLFAEPLSNVVSEAKVAGVPSVVFPVGGLPELIEHKVTGFLCRDSTKEALIEGLEYFLNNPDKRNAAGLAAREQFEKNFGFSRFQRQWAEVFLNSPPVC